VDLFLSHCAIPEYKIEIFNNVFSNNNLIASHPDRKCMGVNPLPGSLEISTSTIEIL